MTRQPKSTDEKKINIELKSLGALAAAFKELEPAAHQRALVWAWDRFITDPGKQIDSLVNSLAILHRKVKP